MLRVGTLWLAACHPHLHRHPCSVCEAASSTMTVEVPCAEPSTSTHVTLDSVSACDANETSDDEMSGSLVERRRAALLRWMARYAAPSSAPSREGCWQAFCHCRATYQPVPPAVAQGAVDYLDHFCKRSQGVNEVSLTSAAVTSRDMSTVPGTLRVPSPLLYTAPSDVTGAGSLHDAFMTRARAALSDDAVAVRKQISFRRTLLDIQCILCGTELRLPFFLACGTALGVRREGYFIPHDEDIDLGVFHDDLVALGARVQTSPSFSAATLAESQAREGVVRLLSVLASSTRFIVIDVCGTVARGLEIRLLHRLTEVRVDINVYYPALQPEDAALVRAGGEFVWTATYYAAAAMRRFGMYRYRHRPFRDKLEMMSFCAVRCHDVDRDETTGAFAVPPVAYLEEAFGPDWRTPRVYNYEQGLAQNEYKNIIDE